jgi:hypothetical protein
MRNENIGSLALCPKHSRERSDDGTTTRWEKACAMSDKIDLPLAHQSMRAHRQARTRIIVGIVCVAVVVALALHWLYQRIPA